MSNITNLQRQHKEIAEVIERLEKLIGTAKFVENSNALSLDIAFLSGKLMNHLQSEDKFLYPELTNHSNPSVRTVSSRFMDEMGNLSVAFVNYKTKYMISQNIKANPEQFSQESSQVFDAIRKRVLAEEKDLYPLLHQ